jgi:hypothetical protein
LSVYKIAIRRGIRFSIPIYISDHGLFRRWIARFLSVHRSLDGCWATLCQPRFLPSPPAIAIRLVEPRPHVFRSSSVAPANVTALYSDAMRYLPGSEPDLSSSSLRSVLSSLAMMVPRKRRPG